MKFYFGPLHYLAESNSALNSRENVFHIFPKRTPKARKNWENVLSRLWRFCVFQRRWRIPIDHQIYCFGLGTEHWIYCSDSIWIPKVISFSFLWRAHSLSVSCQIYENHSNFPKCFFQSFIIYHKVKRVLLGLQIKRSSARKWSKLITKDLFFENSFIALEEPGIYWNLRWYILSFKF